MAESAVEQQQPEIAEEAQPQPQRDLKYLDFVLLAAMQAVVCSSRLYDYAKEGSGPLKPGVQAVEGTVRAVVAPVYDRFHALPYELLKSVDHMVDESVIKLERRLPSSLKEASARAYTAAHRAPVVARYVAGEIKHAGVAGAATGFAKTAAATLEPTAKQLYAKYEPVAEHGAVATWRALNRLPLFPQVAEVAVPTAAHWSERYNSAVGRVAERGYSVAAYLPLVPTERLAKVFAPATAGGEAASDF